MLDRVLGVRKGLVGFSPGKLEDFPWVSKDCEPGCIRSLANVSTDTQGLRDTKQGFMSVLLAQDY